MTFFEPGRYRVAAPSVRILVEPTYTSKLDDQALMGEEVDVLEAGCEFVQILVKGNGKVGWLPTPEQKLTPITGDDPVPTHRVRLPRAITFHTPDAETETMVVLSLNAQIALGELCRNGRDEFARVLGLTVEAWIRTSALMPLGTYETDFVAVQERLLGTPYVWGARDTTLGVDCSALLSLGLMATGQIFCPRDTKDQVSSNWIGEEIDYPPRGIGLTRGDLIFWKGHVATMVDHRRCIHATDLVPHHRVLVQELSEVIHERLIAGKGNVLTVRRFKEYRRQKLKSLVA